MACMILRKKLLGFVSLGSSRQFSSTCASTIGKPEKCFVLGKNGVMAFSGETWQEDIDFFHQNEMFGPAIKLSADINPGDHYEIKDRTRRVFQSAVCVPFIGIRMGVSIANPFRKGNVGILRDLNMVAFKYVESDPTREWSTCPTAGYRQWNLYWKDRANEIYGDKLAAIEPIELRSYSKDLDSVQSVLDRSLSFSTPPISLI